MLNIKKANYFGSDKKRMTTNEFMNSVMRIEEMVAANDSYAKKRLNIAKFKANELLNGYKSAQKPKFINKPNNDSFSSTMLDSSLLRNSSGMKKFVGGGSATKEVMTNNFFNDQGLLPNYSKLD